MKELKLYVKEDCKGNVEEAARRLHASAQQIRRWIKAKTTAIDASRKVMAMKGIILPMVVAALLLSGGILLGGCLGNIVKPICLFACGNDGK